MVGNMAALTPPLFVLCAQLIAAALFPAAFPHGNALKGPPALARTKMLQRRTTGFVKMFVTSGPVATRAEKK
jgi:hypothetical protein